MSTTIERGNANSTQVLFSSPRNNADTHKSLMQTSGCQLLVGDRKRIANQVAEFVKFRDMEDFDFWFQPAEAEPFPSTKSYDEAADETVLILQTSGSTGPSKLVPYRHSTIAVCDSSQELPKIPGREIRTQFIFERGSRLFSVFPPFHVRRFVASEHGKTEN